MNNERKILVVSFQSLTKKSAGGMARLGYYVSRQLHKRGMLKQFIVYSKGQFKTDFPSAPVSPFSRYFLFALNYLNKFIKLPEHKFRLVQEHMFDILCKSHITKDIDILFTTNAHLKRTFRKAKKIGISIIYVPANPEENYINELMSAEYKKLGINGYSPYTYPGRLKFYNDSVEYIDTVVGTYPTVQTTYENSGKPYKLEKITGHLKPDFPDNNITPGKSDGKYNIIYLATTVPLKGLQYLLEAWEDLLNTPEGKLMQLHIVGKIDNGVQQYINKHHAHLANITYAGRVPDVTAYLTNKDLCVVPSLTDGGPYVALEAAQYSIPVILTENCGSAELLGKAPSGCKIIPIRDVQAIKDSILWAYHNRSEAEQMGQNAKRNLEEYDMDSFILRVTDYLEQYPLKGN